MGFLSHGDYGDVRPEQKWDYITLNDFKSTSCFTPLAYAYLYFSLGLSVAVYVVDTFTAVNLLVFNKWSSEITPTQLISFTVSKWIFSVCIILSVVNLAYEHLRAQRIMHRGSVAECYLDNLAVRLESIRWGQGQGWKRFLVFAELTKSKKGAEYIALFTYFSFQSWIRVLLCSGPRQVVNALTLLSVYNAQLSVTGDNVGNTLLNFFDKIRTLAEQNAQEALILSGMIFTLVVWVFSLLSLLLAFAFFVFFLWGYIPRTDGGLSGYCSRKINKRLMKIVATKVNTALAEEERRRKKAELKAARKAGERPPTELTATVPDVGPVYGADRKGAGSTDQLPPMPALARTDTLATLPPYTSRPGTAAAAAAGAGAANGSSFELSALDQKLRPMPSSTSLGSASTGGGGGAAFSGRAPLLAYAADVGTSSAGRPASPAPSLPRLPELGGLDNGSLGGFGGHGYGNSNNGYGAGYDYGPPPPPTRTGTAASSRSLGAGQQPASQGFGLQFSNGSSTSLGSSGAGPGARYMAYRSADDAASGGRASPAPSARSYGPGPGPGPRMQQPQPLRSATNPNSVSAPWSTGAGAGAGYGNGSPYGPPQRNMTAPVPQRGPPPPGPMDYGMAATTHERQFSGESGGSSSYYERPGTAASQRGPPRPQQGGWNGDLEAQRGGGRRY